MTTKLIGALFTAFVASTLGGVICCVLLAVLLQLPVSELSTILMIAGAFLNALLSGCMCTVILLPAAIAEKSRIENSSFQELLKRYLPLITIPLGVLLCFTLYGYIFHKEDFHFLFAYTINIMYMGYICLWAFLKQLKS